MTSRFRFGHATHPDWRAAADLVLAQLSGTGDAARGDVTLGVVYATNAFSADLGGLVDELRHRTGVDAWSGAIGHGVCATGAEYSDEPALAVMLIDLPQDGFRFFSGRRRLPGLDQSPEAGAVRPHTALVHADPALPDLSELVADISARTSTGFLFGGITEGAPLEATQVAGEIFAGGVSGVAFSRHVRVLSRVTQGCAPVGAEHVVSGCTEQYLLELDGRPALDVLLSDLGVPLGARTTRDGNEILRSLPGDRLRQGLFVGFSDGDAGRGASFGDYSVRNVVGIDPHNRLLAVAGTPREGDRAVFCTRDQQAARRDLVRICTELRSEVEEADLQIRGALYHSCIARGERLFGSNGAEMELIRHYLGDVPLIGFHANGEIARDRIYAHTGVLTLFV